jgi:TMEM175 potassium channel family protein
VPTTQECQSDTAVARAVRVGGEDARVEVSGTARMETFSDGVFAIAATLLVLELGIGTGDDQHLGRALLDLWPSYLAYASSFLTIGIIWVNHHDCVACMDRVDRTMLFINTVFLTVVSFIPFPTKLVAEHLQKDGEQAAVYAYALTLLAMAITYNIWWRYASRGRRLIGDAVPQARVDAISRAFDPGIALYLLVLILAVFSPLAAIVLTLILAAFYIPAGALFERLAA